ncbi:MAG: FprA family A-type flavoprotein [Clostridiales bacterium]|nr:FprA family A-type flavoprotein [Clostridiales bacterium]
MFISDSIFYVGVNDHKVDLFEGQYVVPNGMSYNSYVIKDDKIAVMDTVDKDFGEEWLSNVKSILKDKKPDYLIVHHMEPDHCANIQLFAETYPEAVLVGNAKTFTMMENFFRDLKIDGRKLEVKDQDTLSLGKHTLKFIFAPMVHWPEVMMCYETTEKIFFSADAFGTFGALDVEQPWDEEARRYYIGIVGKYGQPVQMLFKKVAGVPIEKICPLHGPILTENLNYYLDKYNTWSSYAVETDGVMIAYSSIYGNTKKAVDLLAKKLKEKGCENVIVFDLARTDITTAVAKAFEYGKLVLASVTYNTDIFPFMKTFITHLTERNYQNRTIALMENGSWAPVAAKVMKSMMEKCKDITYLEPVITIQSSMSDENREQIDKLVEQLVMKEKKA